MSGGHFGYQQWRLDDIASEIEHIIDTNDCTDVDDWGDRKGRNYPPEIIEKFKETVYWLRRSAEMTQRVDWLLSGDDGEESFMKRWETEVRSPTIEDV